LNIASKSSITTTKGINAWETTRKGSYPTIIKFLTSVPLSITKTTGIKVWWASQKRSMSKRFLASAFALPLFPASSMKKGIQEYMHGDCCKKEL